MKQSRSLISLLLLALAYLSNVLSVSAASSMSKDGVTWTFDRNYQTGQYVNGDPWVVGPVTITSITPQPIEGRNGTVVNPPVGTIQGFDKDFTPGYNDYSSALNVGKNLPLTVAPDSSVVSSITPDGWVKFYTIQMFAVLTVVQNAPAAGSFRPPAVGAGSRASVWNESQLDYTKLHTLARAPLTATPNIATYAEWFNHPWLEFNPTWTGGYIRPAYMAVNGYGRYLADRTGDAGILLNLNYSNAEKRNLLIGVVQTGIDNYGFISHGGVWFNDGGWNIGRLTPSIIAACVLNDNNLKSAIKGSAQKFQEFQTTFFVSQQDVDRVHGIWNNEFQKITGTNGDPVFPYTAADIGKPEWGIRHRDNPALDNNFWLASYRDINGGTHTAPTMVAKVMGMRATIDWEPLFQYAQRHLDYEQSSSYKGEFSSNPTLPFHKQFYNTYKNAVPGSGGGGVIIVPPVTTFGIGDQIQVWRNTNVRATGTLSGTLLGTHPSNSIGTILEGPVSADGITWWRVRYDTVEGWSGEDNFVKLTGARPSKPRDVSVKP